MPQLHLTPWMVVMIFAWIIFLAIVPTKIMNRLLQKEPNKKSSKKTKKSNWGWPWF